MVIAYSNGLALQEFIRHQIALDAIVRRLIVIGEAAAEIVPDERRQYPDIERRKIVGLRNLVIHHYACIDDDIIWDVIRNHVPVLRNQVKRALATTSPAQ